MTRTGDSEVDFLVALADRESSGDKECVNGGNYAGLFQMGTGAMATAKFYELSSNEQQAILIGGFQNKWDGKFTERAAFVDIRSLDDFLKNAGAQELAVRELHRKNWLAIQRLGFDSQVGQVIAGIRLSKSGMLASSHLLGVGGLLRFIRSNGIDVARDGTMTPITEYLQRFGVFY